MPNYFPPTVDDPDTYLTLPSSQLDIDTMRSCTVLAHGSGSMSLLPFGVKVKGKGKGKEKACDDSNSNLEVVEEAENENDAGGPTTVVEDEGGKTSSAADSDADDDEEDTEDMADERDVAPQTGYNKEMYELTGDSSDSAALSSRNT